MPSEEKTVRELDAGVASVRESRLKRAVTDGCAHGADCHIPAFVRPQAGAWRHGLTVALLALAVPASARPALAQAEIELLRATLTPATIVLIGAETTYHYGCNPPETGPRGCTTLIPGREFTEDGGFSIDGGALRFFSLPDFETPSDMGTDNMYSVTVSASDGSANVTKDVTVTVTDRDEAGALPLSSTVPRLGTPLTATVTDPDGVTGTTRWTSGSVLPAGPVDEAQTLVRGPYLQSGTSSSVIIKWRTDEATDSVVRYGLDPDGLTLSATNSTSTTKHEVQLTGLSADAGTEEGTEFSLSNAATSPQGTITSIKGTGKFSNEPIATLTFTLQEAAPEITSATTFTVDEGTTAVETLDATDQDSAAADLAWSKAGGADAGQFTLSTAGDLAFAAAPDYENPDDADGDRTYEITVQVSDGDNTDPADIRVTLKNVIELLTELTGPSSTDYAENGAVRVATYNASSEADRDGIAWQLGGDDAEYFSIDNPLGVLRFHIDPVDPSLFLQPPDFEAPVDDDDDNVYEVIVFAQAGSALTLKSVFVTVTDENEAGTLTLSSSRPRLGTALTATLSDPDTVSGTVEWKWERSAGRNAWTVIDGAASSIYTPVAADGENYLRATASYTDRHPSGKEVRAVAPNVVLAHTLSRLGPSVRNRISFYSCRNRATGKAHTPASNMDGAC